MHFFQHQLVEKLSYPQCEFLALLWESVSYEGIPAFYSVHLVYVSAFMSKPCFFDYSSFAVYFEVSSYDAASFVFCTQGYLFICDLLRFHT